MAAIQIRDVPPELHARLRANAETEGLSLSQYLLRELEGIAASVPFDQWMRGLRAGGPIAPEVGASRIVDALRFERGESGGR